MHLSILTGYQLMMFSNLHCNCDCNDDYFKTELLKTMKISKINELTIRRVEFKFCIHFFASFFVFCDTKCLLSCLKYISWYNISGIVSCFNREHRNSSDNEKKPNLSLHVLQTLSSKWNVVKNNWKKRMHSNIILFFFCLIFF